MISGPPHKQRYCVLSAEGEEDDEAASLLRDLQTKLFPSTAFRAWLALVTSLIPLGYIAQARRFRPGYDYSLARSEDTEARLDVTLTLSPDGPLPTPPTTSAPAVARGRGAGKKTKKAKRAVVIKDNTWEEGDVGGWECYMAPDEEAELDPAVYRSATKSSKMDTEAVAEGEDEEEEEEEDEEDDEEESDDEDDGSALLTLHPAHNSLALVLRDTGVLRFIKYVSARAGASRWDVSGEWEVGMVEEDDEEDDEEDEEATDGEEA